MLLSPLLLLSSLASLLPFLRHSGTHGRSRRRDGRLTQDGLTQATAIKSVKSILPLLDRVLVHRLKGESKTASGIYIPERNVEKLSEARVLAVGPGGMDKEGKRVVPSVQSGQRVLIPPYGGSNIKVGEEEYTLFRESEILATVHE